MRKEKKNKPIVTGKVFLAPGLPSVEAARGVATVKRFCQICKNKEKERKTPTTTKHERNQQQQ